MSIEQVAFVIPPEIESALEAGKLIRYGGVVRNGAGQIVLHLDEAPITKFDRIPASVGKFVKTNKVALVVASVSGAIVLGALAIAQYKKPKDAEHKKLDDAEKQLESALSAYCEAIDTQDMNLTVVNELVSSLDEFHAVVGKPAKATINSDILELLIQYSREFILHNAPDQLKEIQDSQLVILEDYLAKQKKILEEAS